jgi:hypothetical protein
MKAKEQVFTMNLRETLKQIMQQEIEKLPETLAALEPKERIALVCRLLPYVVPKVEAVSPTEGEPISW